MNKYLSVVESMFPAKENPDSVDAVARDVDALRQSHFNADGLNRTPAILQRSKDTGVSPDLVADTPQLQEDPIDYTEIASQSPQLARWLKDPNNLAGVRKDIAGLSYLERQLKSIGAGHDAGDRTTEMSRRMGQAASEIERGAPIDPDNFKRATELGAVKQERYGIDGFFEEIPTAVANQIPIQLEMLFDSSHTALMGMLTGAAVGGAIAAPTGPGAAVGAATGAGVGLRTGWQVGSIIAAGKMERNLALLEYLNEKDANGNPTFDNETAYAAATVVGVFNGTLEGLFGIEPGLRKASGLDRFAKRRLKELLAKPETKAILKRYAKDILRVSAAEGSTEAMQEMITIAGAIIGRKDPASYEEDRDPIAEFFTEENMARVFESARGGTQAGAGMQVGIGAPQLAVSVADMNRAKQNAETWKKIGETMKATQPSSDVAPLKEMAGAANVFIDAETWQRYFQDQAGIDPSVAAKEILGSVESYTQALEAGAPIAVPVDVYASKIAPTAMNDFFRREVRADPLSMNAREADTFSKNMEKADKNPEDTAVLEELTRRLGGARYDAQTAEDLATPMAAFLKQMEERSGLATDAELLERHGLTMGREELGEGVSLAQEEDALFDPEALAAAANQNPKSRTKLIRMKIDDFLSMAQAGFDVEKRDNVEALLKSGTKFNSIPFLNVDVNADGNALVVGHEGRHRARALKEAGHTTMPVLLNTDRVRFGSQKPGSFDYIENWPKTLRSQNQVLPKEIPFPVSREQAGETLSQGPVENAEDAKWSAWTPETNSNGAIKGAPEGVTKRSMGKLYAQLKERIAEGMVGRYWYEESARKILAVTNGNFAEAEKLTQLIAIYSPQAKVQVNTIFAVRAWNQWKNGVPREDFKVKTSDQDNKAIDVLYDNKDFEGRKTNSFYLNLMHEIVAMPEAAGKLKLDEDLVAALNKPATIDLWMYRAFGYRRHVGADDKGHTGRYSFAENAVRKLTADLNLALAPGEPRWTPHQVQAAIWTSMKARYEMPEVKEATWLESIKKGFAKLNDKGQRTVPTTPEATKKHLEIWRKHAMKLSSEQAIEAANASAASFKDYLTQLTQIVTWEAIPSTALPHAITTASPRVKEQFSILAKDLLLGEQGEDLLAQQLGVPLAGISGGLGGYASTATPSLLSRILPTKPAGDYSREEVRLYAAALQYIFKQDAVPWMRPDARAIDSKAAQKEQQFRVVKGTRTAATFETLAEAQAYATRGVSAAIKKTYKGRQLHQILNNSIGSGPFDGGCLIAAKAIIRAAGSGALVRLVSEVNGAEQTEHYGAYIGGVIYDFNGGHASPGEWANSFAETERVERPLSYAEGYDSTSAIPDEPSVEKEVANLLNRNGIGALSVRGGKYQRTMQLTMTKPLDFERGQALQLALEAALGPDAGFTRISPTKVLVVNFRDGETGVPFLDDEIFLDKMHELGENYEGISNGIALWSEGEYGPRADWQSDPQGEKILDHGGIADRPGLRDWVQGRRKLFEQLLAQFDAPGAIEQEEQTTQVLDQKVFHGSPHTFDEFKLQAIGTGEGAQAYGWGMYFSSSKEIAKWYRDQLVKRKNKVQMAGTFTLAIPGSIEKFDVLTTSPDNLVKALMSEEGRKLFPYKYGSSEQVLRTAAEVLLIEIASTMRQNPGMTSAQLRREMNKRIDQDNKNQLRQIEWNEQALSDKRDSLNASSRAIAERSLAEARERQEWLLAEKKILTLMRFAKAEPAVKGRLYEVEIPEPDTMLDWDKPLSEQPEQVQAVLGKLAADDAAKFGEGGGLSYYTGDPDSYEGRDIYKYLREQNSGPEAASKALLAAGITGIKYKGGTTNVDNFVVFDDSLVKIEKMEQEKRGEIWISPNRKLHINLLEKADLSTFIHESGHAYLEIFHDLTKQLRGMPLESLNELQKQMLEDAYALEKWMGISSLDEMTVEHKEQFARGWEAYTMEGNAPSISMRRIFARFRSWMLAIYKHLTGLNVTLNPEVRSVFDRMIATDAEIDAAKNDLAAKSVFTDAIAAGMSDREYAAYLTKIQDANTQATEELQTQLMVEEQRERTKWWKEESAKVAEEVLLELDSDKDYLARSALLKGKSPSGKELAPIKIDRAEAKAKGFGKLMRGMLDDGGVSIKAAADLIGFGSEDALVESLGKPMASQKVYVAQETQRRMLAKHGDMRNDGRMADAARQAVANEKRQEVIVAELKAISKLHNTVKPILEAKRKDQADKVRRGVATLRAVPSLRVIQQIAAGRIEQMRFADLLPGQWLASARRASLDAQGAIIEEDYASAAVYKQRELLSLEMYRQVGQVKERTQKNVEYLRSFTSNTVRARIGKTSQVFLEQIDALLEKVDLAPRSMKQVTQRTKLKEWVEAQVEAGQIVDEDLLEYADSIDAPSFRQMTVAELNGFTDAVRHIQHLSRLKGNLLRRAKEREVAVIRGQMQAAAQATGKRRAQSLETELPQDQARKTVAATFAGFRKMSSIARQMDGQDGGVFWEHLIRPLNDAANAEMTMAVDGVGKLSELLKPYLGLGQRVQAKLGVVTAGLAGGGVFKPEYFQGVDYSLSKVGQLMVALNLGNPLNRQRLRDGFDWTDENIDELTSRLTAEDWQVVQGIWDLFESYKAQAFAVEQRTIGVAPEAVIAVPVKTPFGELRGGYFPIRWNQELGAKGGELSVEETAKQSINGAAIRGTTRRGNSKARFQGAVNKDLKVRLDLGVIYQHLNEVIKDITHREALHDVNTLLRDRGIREAITNYHGKDLYDQFKQGLNDIAVGDRPSNTKSERFVDSIRRGSSVAAMGWNLLTAAIQPLGFTQSIVRIGPKWVAKGVMRFFHHPDVTERMTAHIYAKSPFMRDRSRTMLREVNEIRNRMEGDTGLNQSYFFLIAKMQQFVDVPTWLGGYEKAWGTSDTMDEKTAIALADQAVIDSQSSGLMKDLADIQKGSAFKKLFTNFYSYFSATYNQSAESIRRTKTVRDVPKLFTDMLLLYTIPSVLGTLLHDAFKGNDDDDDLETRLMYAHLSYIAAAFPYVREVGGAIQGYANYSGPAGTRFFDTLSDLITQSRQGEIDVAWGRSLNQFLGITLHYPATQIQRVVEGVTEYVDSNDQSPLIMLTGPERKQ